MTRPKLRWPILSVSLPGETRLGFRVYGHQSLSQKRDCQDTALVVPFGAVSENKVAVLASMRSIEARGYTPITHVLKLAADDLTKEEAGARVVVLVSDGQETCAKDPCAAAKALAAADAKLVVHTIGLGVDAAAKLQLQCIANVAKGTYFDASTRGQLASALGEAAKKAAAPVKTEITIRSNAPGRIEVRGADRDTHAVFDAESGQRIEVVRPNTGQKVDGINSLWPVVEVPASTMLRKWAVARCRGQTGPDHGFGARRIGDQQCRQPRHKVLAETGEVVAELFFGKKRVTLLPSRFSVTFGQLVWPDVELKPGKTTTLNPGVSTFAPPVLPIRGHSVRRESSERLAQARTGWPCPPVIIPLMRMVKRFRLS